MGLIFASKDGLPQLREETIAPDHAHIHDNRLNCGADLLHRRAPQPFFRRQEALELQYQDWARQSNRSAATPPPFVIPIVFHILHNNGPENIGDLRIVNALDQLNASMANIGYYDQGTGTNTQIQFCLAQRTPDNLLSNGITRQVTELTELQADTEDLELKDLARWNTNEYLNVYVVREICGLGLGCGVAGYAYLPSAHGGPLDGIVIQASSLGEDEADNTLLTHEVGHYLGLFHTFEGGCANDDCLINGDRVCDTPPDNSTAPVPCGSVVNTCTTDANSGFATDQPDMYINYMDYGFSECFSAFTPRQADRMHFFIEGVRASLLASLGCISPCPQPVTADFTGIPDSTIDLGTTLNLTSTSINSDIDSWFVNDVFQSTGNNFSFTFTDIGDFTITLESASSDSTICLGDERTITVRVVCPYEPEITSSDQIPLEFTNVTYSTVDDAPFYEWTVDGVVVSNASTFDYTVAESGTYELCLRKGIGVCEQTRCLTIFVVNAFQPCSGETFAQYLQWEEGPGAEDVGAYRAILQDGADLAIAGVSDSALHFAKLSALGEPIWSKRIGLPDRQISTLNKIHFLIDDGGQYLVYCALEDETGEITAYLLVKYDPINDQVLFSETYDTRGVPVFVGQRQDDDYMLINNSGARPPFGQTYNYLSVDQNDGLFEPAGSINISAGRIDSSFIVTDAVQVESDVSSISTFVALTRRTANVPGSDSYSIWVALDQTGDFVFGATLGPDIIPGLDSLRSGQLWLDGISLIASSTASTTTGETVHILTKFGVFTNIDWQQVYSLPENSVIEDIHQFLNGYLMLVSYESSIGLIFLDEFGNLVWSRSLGDNYDDLSLNGQNLLVIGDFIFVVGGRNINSGVGSDSLVTFVYRLDAFGFFEDQCIAISDFDVNVTQSPEAWSAQFGFSNLDVIPSLGSVGIALEDQPYSPDNTCNSPCFEICDNGIDDDGNGETDCDDAALAQTCCCLPGPQPPILPDTSLCLGETWAIQAPEFEGGSFSWSTGSPDSLLVIAVAGSYSLLLTDSCGRDTTVSFLVDYIPLRMPPDLGPDTTVCANGVIGLDAGH
ncbi:MAG: M43 family zinc metalloprotease, partial [Bacteroidota bacterium]